MKVVLLSDLHLTSQKFRARMDDVVPQVSQFLYLDYSSVTDKHWSVRGEKK